VPKAETRYVIAKSVSYSVAFLCDNPLRFFPRSSSRRIKITRGITKRGILRRSPFRETVINALQHYPPTFTIQSTSRFTQLIYKCVLLIAPPCRAAAIFALTHASSRVCSRVSLFARPYVPNLCRANSVLSTFTSTSRTRHSAEIIPRRTSRRVIVKTSRAKLLLFNSRTRGESILAFRSCWNSLIPDFQT